MRIEEDVKLDFSDVLIRPKRSTLTSRFDVEMERTYTFCHSKKQWKGVPIIASNMDTTGTFKMHEALRKHSMITCIARHHNKDIDTWLAYDNWNKYKMKQDYLHSCVMSGISEKEIDDYITALKKNKGKPEYSISEIFLPSVDQQQASQVRELANRLIQKIQDGGNFAAIARNFSQSPTAAVGGSLGWNNTEQLKPNIKNK